MKLTSYLYMYFSYKRRREGGREGVREEGGGG